MSKKKKSSGSKSNFNPKEFLILHVEKLVFGLIAGIACVVMYLGFNTKPFPSEKTPEKLQEQAMQVSRGLKENHNEVIMKEEGRKVDPIYAKSALNTRIIKDPIAHASNPMGASKTNTSSKRGDPSLLAPKHLEASYFYGAVARLSTIPDPLDKLEDAKKPEEKVKPENNQERSFKGKGGSSSMGSAGSGSGSGGVGFEGEGGMAGSSMGMMGSGGGSDPLMAGQRRLSPMYDLGYKFGMRTFPETNAATSMFEAANSTKPDTAVKKPVAMALGLVCVTALAPHEEMEDDYKKQFYEVVGYTVGRDTPNYVGFEAQRAEVSAANPDKEIAETDWVALPKAGPATFKDQLKVLQGTANEVHLPDWVDPNISMPIPPILLTDYRKYATNSVLAELELEKGALGTGSATGYSGGSSMGMGMSSGSGGSMGEGESGSGSSAPGAGSMGMPGSGSMGMAGGMAKGGKSSGGSMGSSGSFAGSGGGFDGGGTTNVVMDMPKQLPSTKYKLVRFYDVNPPAGKVFKYRVRLLMYDSNHPEWAMFKPAASTLNSEALKRVQGAGVRGSERSP